MENKKDFELNTGNDKQGLGRDQNQKSMNKNSEEKTIPVIEESVNIDKRWVETGKVHISKKVSEHEEDIDVSLTHEEVDIERVKVNQYVDTLPPPVRYEGDTMIIPVLKEIVVKRVMVVEELRITKKEVQTKETQHVTLKKEEVNIDRTSNQ